MSPGRSRAASTVAGAALLIGVLTALARVAGFGRTFVFARTVGQTCLGDVYQSANTVPNVVFEIVAGGALASVVVPLLAGSVAAGDRDRASRTASALLTWTVSVLVPLAVLVAVFAHPIATLLLGDKTCGDAQSGAAVDAAAGMLRVFAPQVVLYGVGIVLTGVLQAHRRFGGPALAPLLSSLVVIACYVTFGVVAGPGTDIGSVTVSDELILSVGTTLGVVALSLSLVVPLRGTGLRLRPTYTFPTGLGRRARNTAASGVVALVAQQCSVVVALVLSNAARVPDGSVTVFLYAQTIFLLPWAILAVPVATSVFPRLSEDAERGDLAAYRHQLRPALSAIATLAAIATAAMIGASREIATVMVGGQPGTPSEAPLSAGVAAFGVGLLGYSLFALGTRALYALGDARRNAVAAAAGWLSVVVADLVLSALLDPDDRVAALSWGNSIGVTVLGLALTVSVLRHVGESVGRAAGFLLAVLLVGVAVGGGIRALALPAALEAHGSVLAAVLAGTVRGTAAAVVAIVLLAAVPGSGVRRLLQRRTGRATQPEQAWNDREPGQSASAAEAQDPATKGGE